MYVRTLNLILLLICSCQLTCAEKLLTPVTVEPASSEDSEITDTGEDSETDTYPYQKSAVQTMVGYATVDNDGNPYNFTDIFDEKAMTVTVSSIAEFDAALNAKTDPDTALIVLLAESDDWTAPTTEPEQLNIEGKQNVYVEGDGSAVALTGIGVRIKDSSNIVVRNLRIQNVPTEQVDCINVDNSQHVIIDHCEVFNDKDADRDAYDSLLDIINGSDFVTVSWNRFRDNVKGLNVGNDDINDVDKGKQHVTWHHNYFSNIAEGFISIRFGTNHVFNNIFSIGNDLSTIAVSSRMGACVRVELNKFDGFGKVDAENIPLRTTESGTTEDTIGYIAEIANYFGESDPGESSPTCSGDDLPPYEYLSVINSTANLNNVLVAGKIGCVDDLPPL
ncbi:MAG: hypothetical protein JXR76_25830 [Deltaproteobacteria bacterium]|nr:hypothetical protein [Deltaproteobacteria bacterium]